MCPNSPLPACLDRLNASNEGGRFPPGFVPGRGIRDWGSPRWPFGLPSELRLDYPVQQGFDRLGGGQTLEQHLANGAGNRHVDAQFAGPRVDAWRPVMPICILA